MISDLRQISTLNSRIRFIQWKQNLEWRNYWQYETLHWTVCLFYDVAHYVKMFVAVYEKFPVKACISLRQKQIPSNLVARALLWIPYIHEFQNHQHKPDAIFGIRLFLKA